MFVVDVKSGTVTPFATGIFWCDWRPISGAASAGDAQSAEAAHQRVAAKAERVKEGLQTWVASGRDPSAIVKTLQEAIKPLLEAGKFSEAEPELDRVLEQLKPDAK